MPKGDPHPSTLPGFRGTRDPERFVTRSRSGRKKKRVEFEDVQTQDIPNPTEDNFPRRCITQLPDGNRDSMRVHDTFTTVFKVWKDIVTLPAVRDAVVNIFGQFIDIRLDNSDNRLIQALTERWWPTTHTFLFPCAEIGVTLLNFTMLTSLSIGRYPTQVSYDDTWSILPNASQLLPNIDSSHIKSESVSIAHLKTYLTIEADREDDITIARAFILFVMGHLWFQTANDTVLLGYLAAVNDLDSAAQYDWGYATLASMYHGLDTAVTTGGAITGFVQLLPYWFYEYCGVGHPIVKEEVKYPAYPYLRVWERGKKRKTNDQAANLFIIGRYHIDHHTVEAIIWEPWFDSTVSEIEDNAKLLSRKRIPLQVPNRNCEYYLGDRCWRQVTGEDFSLPGEAAGPDLGWHMEWTGRHENLPITHLRDPPPMSSSYDAEELWHLTHGMRRLVLAESTRDAQRLQEVEDELAIAPQAN
ncbi:hypothetical protein GIB67_000216 [Kingdonia uniflora]|uniref:Aminotransferase-like plant mobile domain-containing protein n=1 Tax=Kingdonia uniflora TaxID=39325 RepID=A0A7J7PA08_9MAGN|nr:hypothetical protein GIB67_000216 [Kingdonia uniflora]